MPFFCICLFPVHLQLRVAEGSMMHQLRWVLLLSNVLNVETAYIDVPFFPIWEECAWELCAWGMSLPEAPLEA